MANPTQKMKCFIQGWGGGCYPSVIATEALEPPIMNERDNNVTGYIIQMIQQQAELCGAE